MYPLFVLIPGAVLCCPALTYPARCGEGLYSLQGGSSNGSVGVSFNRPCYTCPLGGVCNTGGVVASAFHWGAPDVEGVVSFSACPTGSVTAPHVPS